MTYKVWSTVDTQNTKLSELWRDAKRTSDLEYTAIEMDLLYEIHADDDGYINVTVRAGNAPEILRLLAQMKNRYRHGGFQVEATSEPAAQELERRALPGLIAEITLKEQE